MQMSHSPTHLDVETVIISRSEFVRARNHIGVVTAHKMVERLCYSLYVRIIFASNITFQVKKNLSSSDTNLTL